MVEKKQKEMQKNGMTWIEVQVGARDGRRGV